MNRFATLFTAVATTCVSLAEAQQVAAPPYVPAPVNDLIAFVQTSGALTSAEQRRIFDGYVELIHQQATLTPNPFFFRGESVTVHPTPHPVRDHAPTCGEMEEATLDGEARLIRDALVKGGFASLHAYPVVGATAMLLGAAVGAISPRRVNYSHCKAACVLVPAKIDQKVIEDFGYVTLEYTTPFAPQYKAVHTLKKPVGGLIDLRSWAAWDTPSFTILPVPATAVVLPKDHPAKNPRLDNAQGCESTLVCGRLRNWSDTWQRTAQIGVGLQLGPWTKDSCLDISAIDKTTQESLFLQALLKKDMHGLVLRKYSDALLQPVPQLKLP